MSDNTNDVTITTKIYPTAYKNRKGFRVGNMKIKFDTKNAPFTSTDQIDHYLNELFSYIKWASTKKEPKDETLEDRKRSIYDFLKAKKIEHVFSPKFIVDENKGGKAKSTRKGSYKSNSYFFGGLENIEINKLNENLNKIKIEVINKNVDAGNKNSNIIFLVCYYLKFLF